MCESAENFVYTKNVFLCCVAPFVKFYLKMEFSKKKNIVLYVL